MVSSLHSLLLLSDSALPLGSFAFSSGLESFLAHVKHESNSVRLQAFTDFLNHSLENLASTALPYVLATFHEPKLLDQLDNDFDASTPCTVARRASTAQGRALLTLWEKALSTSAPSKSHAAETITAFAAVVKISRPDEYGLQLNAHFAPIFGVVCSALNITLEDTAYIFLLNHAKAVLSAAVRASVMGPYQSQTMLASTKLQEHIKLMYKRYREHRVEDVAVTIPMMDIWMGRHELLYSRIFNS